MEVNRYHRRERDRLLSQMDSLLDRIQLGRPQYMQTPPEKIEEPEDDPLPEWAPLG